MFIFFNPQASGVGDRARDQTWGEVKVSTGVGSDATGNEAAAGGGGAKDLGVNAGDNEDSTTVEVIAGAVTGRRHEAAGGGQGVDEDPSLGGAFQSSLGLDECFDEASSHENEYEDSSQDVNENPSPAEAVSDPSGLQPPIAVQVAVCGGDSPPLCEYEKLRERNIKEIAEAMKEKMIEI